MADNATGKPGAKRRYGIGEWYGRSFVNLTPEERQHLAEIQFASKRTRPVMPCLPRMAGTDEEIPCTKPGGICSLRQYEFSSVSGTTTIAPGPAGTLVTTCPNRFEEGQTVLSWIGEVLLGHPAPLVISEVGFLKPVTDLEATGGKSVGNIDNILIHPQREPLAWCALEVQAVYFSGSSMGVEFRNLQASTGPLPFPVGQRRPDYRSSGPKRLMPQLQIKVPTLRRWGKKMAVLVDESFFSALGKMDHVSDVSNCDIAWFVVRYDETEGEAHIEPGFVQFTTLERAVEGLTAGEPVSLDQFEARILRKQRR